MRATILAVSTALLLVACSTAAVPEQSASQTAHETVGSAPASCTVVDPISRQAANLPLPSNCFEGSCMDDDGNETSTYACAAPDSDPLNNMGCGWSNENTCCVLDANNHCASNPTALRGQDICDPTASPSQCTNGLSCLQDTDGQNRCLDCLTAGTTCDSTTCCNQNGTVAACGDNGMCPQ